MEKGLVFGIQHFSIHDGPGIRSTVFLKGCPLRCLWCHNPEGLSCNIDLEYVENECTHCGSCGFIYNNMAKVNDLNPEVKRKIAKNCPNGALQIVGTYMSVDEVLNEVMKDRHYFETSGGGLTLSGGEPMMQPDFAIALAKRAKENHISTALETCGFSSLENYKKIMPYIDVFLWDYKASDVKTHEALVGVSNTRILENLAWLYEQGAKIILRCPLIPGVNDSEEHLDAIAKMHRRFPNLAGVQIMPYHNLGTGKAKRIGFHQNKYQVPGKDTKEYWEKRTEISDISH